MLFDLDDTLFDRDAAFRHWAESFVKNCLGAHDDVIYERALNDLIVLDQHGYTDREPFFAKIKESYPFLRESVDQLIESYYPDFFSYITPDEGACKLLDRLRKLSIPFGIVTNGSSPQMQKIRLLGLHKLTTCIFISELFGYHKPNAKIFTEAVACLGVPIEEVLFVGDSPHTDIIGAYRVGLTTAWLRRQQPWPAELINIAPDITISSLEDLLILFEPISTEST